MAAPSLVQHKEIRYLNAFLGVKATALALVCGLAWVLAPHARGQFANLAFFGTLLAIAAGQMAAARMPRFRFPALAAGFALEPGLFTVAIFLINHQTGNTFLTTGCPHFALYYVALAQTAILLKRRVVVFSGASTVLALFGFLVWLSWLEMGAPDIAESFRLLPSTLGHAGGFRSFLVANMAMLTLETGVLLVVVHIGRRLLAAWSLAESARTNFARYFSPRMVEALMQQESPIGSDRRQNVAVLFVDMRGFTGLAEAMEPEAVLGLLREFHRRCEAEVFRCNGFMEKFVGDALLVAFGVPESTDRDARNAFECAQGILRSVDDWNAARRVAGHDPIGVGIGLHYGPAVLGEIGSHRSVTFAVIGDTVNVASRLQLLTKRIGAPLVASDEFVAELRAESGGSRLPGLAPYGDFAIEGRRNRIAVWASPSVPADAEAPPPLLAPIGG